MPTSLTTPLATAVAALLLPAAASAALCDYKPSRLLGSMVSAANARTGGPAAAAGAVGHYTLVNAKTGLTLLGATGGSATGLAAGASGFLASTIAFVTAPAVIVTGSVTAVALGGYEGACYFSVERVTDPELVIAILRDMESEADPDRFALVTPQNTGKLTLVLRDPATPERVRTYEAQNLYIADGMLLHRDRLLNTRIGKVIFVDESGGGAQAPSR